MTVMEWLCYGIACYFLGNIMTGFMVARWLKGVDLRQEGSGNIGARNAGRVLGPVGFLLTLIGDLVKGAFGVWLGNFLEVPALVQIVGLFLVMAGHCWPLVLRFKGGKGVATFIGGILVFQPIAALWMGGLFLILFAIKRSLTFAGLISFLVYPVIFMAHTHLWLQGIVLFLPAITVAGVQKDELKERMNL